MRIGKWLVALCALSCAHSFHDSTGWTPQPAGADADPQAQQVIDQMWTAMGVLPAFQTRGELRFTWNFFDSGSMKKSEYFYWNRFENRIRWEEATPEGEWIAVRVDTQKGTARAYHKQRQMGGTSAGTQSAAALKRSGGNVGSGVPLSDFDVLPAGDADRFKQVAMNSFHESRRWLLGPINLRDPGIHVKRDADEPPPGDDSGKKLISLHVSFDEKADAEKKGDEQWWLVDPDTHLPLWLLWRQEGHEGKSAWSQEDWQDVGGGLKLPLSHKQYKGQVEIRFANVQLTEHPDDDLYFESVK
jgi:hypothetical protein